MQHLFVIGASGVLGHATALHFLRKGCRVSGLVRDMSKAEDLKKEGAAITVADLSVFEPDPSLFKDVEVVLAATHSIIGKGKNASAQIDDRANRLLIDAAKKAGVKQFIFASLHDVSPDHPIDFYRTKYNVEEYLKKSGLNYTILHLSAFMEWHAYNLLGKNIVEKGKTTLFGKGENKNNFVAVQDVVTALNQITGNAFYFNKTVSISGPENLSKNEVAAQFAKSLGIESKVSHVPESALKMMSVLIKPFHPGLSRVMKLSVWTEHSNQSRDSSETIQQFGMMPTSMESFVKKVVSKPKVVSGEQVGSIW